MNVLYLTYDGLTDPLGQSQVLPYVIGLSKKGWSASVISFEKKGRFTKKSIEIQSILVQYQIEWTPLFYTKKPPIISTLIDLQKMRSGVRKLCETKKIDIIHSRSYLPMLIALPFQKNGVKVLFDMRGFWPDERVEGNIWKLSNPIYNSIYKYFKKKEKQFLKSADSIVSLTESAIPELIKLGAQNEVTVIPTSTDLSLFEPTEINKEKQIKWEKKLSLNDKYVLGYSGSLGTWYLLEEMLIFFKTLKMKITNAHFLIISKDPIEIVVKKAMAIGLSQDDFSIIEGERAEMPLLYSLFDIAVMFIKPTYSKKASSPTKLGELMSMGIPVFCNANVGDVKEIVNRYHAGLVLEKLDINSFETAMEVIRNDDFYSIEAMKKGAKEYYDLNIAISKYDDIYRSLT